MAKPLEITTGQYVKINYIEASISSRILAFALDMLLLITIYLALYAIGLDVIFNNYSENTLFLYVVMVVIVPSINMFIEFFSNGQSLGKMATHIVTVSESCQPPKFYQCLLRWILFPVDCFAFLGLIFCIIHGQRVGDMAAGCRIVYTSKKSYTNVNLEKDYRFVELDYKPRFTSDNVKNMTDHDEEMVVKALYDVEYNSITNSVAKRISERIGLEIPQNMSRSDFLLQLHNDYLYHKCHKY